MEHKISIIIPCRNEEKYIGECIASVLAQSRKPDEILVVDGMSTDDTCKIAEKYPVRILHNLNKFTPYALNIGIKEATGDIIIRMDAHARYEYDYIKNCVKHLLESGADNVGGNMTTLAGADTKIAKTIAKVMGSTGAKFRTGADKPQEVDTVWGGCFKKSLFAQIGEFNENLRYSQDMEFNMRIKKHGGRIMLYPDIISYYYAEPTLWKFIKHNFKDGIWSTYPLKFGIVLKLRHYVPLFICLITACIFLWFGILLWYNEVS